jgi:hypothetical protein
MRARTTGAGCDVSLFDAADPALTTTVARTTTSNIATARPVHRTMHQ